ncbi:hypothetical protein BC941DRAFT_407406 [Chlamydoabsidia padenii]|nr:hypothetical protein BC941DRAFT_407406 [Chlamydoabsidia padenii]
MKRNLESDEDTTTWKKPRTSSENLQLAANSLEDTLKELHGSVAALESVTPDISRLAFLTTLERNYVLATYEELEDTKTIVTDGILPQITKLLAEAQTIIDNQKTQTEQFEQKVDEQDKALKSKPPTNHTDDNIHLSLTEQEQEQVNKEKQRKRLRHKSLLVEFNTCDNIKAGLELELERLEEELRYTEQQIPHHTNATPEQSMTMEEKRLINELDQLERQGERKHKNQQEQKGAAWIDDNTMVIDMDISELTLDVCQKYLSTTQNLLDELIDSTVCIPTKTNDLSLYSKAINQLQTKYFQSLQLEQKVENKIRLLKTCCKTLITKDNMGFIAQRLIDVLFTKDGYSALTKESLLQKFESHRQKDTVKKLIDNYDLSFIQ